MKKKPIIKDRHERFLYRFEECTHPGTCSVDEWDRVHTVTPAKDYLRLRKIGIVKETEKGFWINMSGCRYHSDKRMELENFIGQKYEVPVMFVLKGIGKRFAYETVEAAAESYRIRKDRHLFHLQRQINRINIALELLDKGEQHWGQS